MNKLNLRLMIANNTKKRQGVFVVRAVSALLFFSLFLLTEVCSAQTKVVALRDKERIPEENRNFPRGYYFEDQHHDLDKFAGEWEGVGVGGYQWRVRIAVQKKLDCFRDYWSDTLGLDLSITKDGKPAITPTRRLIPGTSFIRGTDFRWDREKKSIDPNTYMVLFSYGEADKPYKAAIVVYLYMNPDQDTIVLRQGVIIAIDEIPNIPDYVIAGGLRAEICTLRRVKK
nr:hypothetical protein [uncultured Porphyromonas sp.]